MTKNLLELNPRAPLEPLLKIEDLERLLRVDRRTIARLCKRGQLPQPLKVGGSNRWKVEDIDEAIQAMRGSRPLLANRREEVVAVLG